MPVELPPSGCRESASGLKPGFGRETACANEPLAISRVYVLKQFLSGVFLRHSVGSLASRRATSKMVMPWRNSLCQLFRSHSLADTTHATSHHIANSLEQRRIILNAEVTSHDTTHHAVPEETMEFIRRVRQRVATVVVGQEVVVERILIALFTSGHLLLQGVPGLAKTLLVSCIAKSIDLSFGRVQFTIDLLPSDILGSEILDQRDNTFRTHKGPVFTNLLLADEINRAAPKVQSALLEAMQERKVTIGNESFSLPAPFLVIATQNPVEQAGTFELPEAQLDRFMLCHRLDYPSIEEEKEVFCEMLRSASSAKKAERSRAPNSTFWMTNPSAPSNNWCARWRRFPKSTSARRLPTM